ncbi:MAG TPA: hypothetical protein VFF27_07935 [Bacteroidia bacterium]|jgi:cyanophycinase|nr:hypothetical protein [Bacteroidia bacterium]
MANKIPKGKLFLIGGAEDKDDGRNDMEQINKNFERFEVLKTVLPKKQKRRIEIITTASSVPDEIEKCYEEAFTKIGFHKVAFINMGNNLRCM